MATDDDIQLHQLYKRVKQDSNGIDIRPNDRTNLPSRRILKKEGLKYFNESSLTDQYVKFNEPDTLNLRDALQAGVLDQIKDGLKAYEFYGDFSPVGSFYDGTKVTTVNEFDCMFVCDGSRYKPQKLEENGIAYRLYDHNYSEVHAGDLRTKLADAINELAADLELPDGLTHGGFASPDFFSGVRINKPAITLLFVWTKEKEATKWKPIRRKIPLSIDITLALSVPRSLEEDVTKDVWNVIGPVRSKVDAPIDFKGKVHFIPVVDDCWNITSTLLEAEILRLMDELPIKKCIKLAKITVYERIAKPDLDKEYANKSKSPAEVQHWQKSIENELERYRTSRTRTRSHRRRVQLILRHGHILMTPDISKKYGDMRRTPMSVVSAAIKHLTLKTFCQNPAYHTNYGGVEFDMLVDVFKALGDLHNQTVRHFLLCEDIKMVSIAPYAQHEADLLIRHVKFECMRLGKRLNGTKIVGSLSSYIVHEQKKLILISMLIFAFCFVLGG